MSRTQPSIPPRNQHGNTRKAVCLKKDYAIFYMSGRRDNTHGPEVFIVGCTMNAWAEVSPTITEAAVNFILLSVRDKESGVKK